MGIGQWHEKGKFQGTATVLEGWWTLGEQSHMLSGLELAWPSLSPGVLRCCDLKLTTKNDDNFNYANKQAWCAHILGIRVHPILALITKYRVCSQGTYIHWPVQLTNWAYSISGYQTSVLSCFTISPPTQSIFPPRAPLADGAIGGCLHVTRSPEWWVWEVFWPPGGCSTAFWERRGKIGWRTVCNQPCWRSCWERKDQSDRIHGSEKLLKA